MARTLSSRKTGVKLGFGVVLLSLVVLWAAPAQAQVTPSTGTVTISGAASAAVKLTSGGNASLAGNSGGGVTSASPADGTLATVVDFGDVGPGNTSAFVCFTETLYLRANAASTLSAAVTAESFPAGVQKTDIGIGFTGLAASGPISSIATSTLTAAFDANPCAAAKDADGVPTYSRNLSNLATATPGTAIVTSTGSISLRGGFNSPNNRAILDMRMAIAPQAFTSGAFSATITLTLTSP